MELKDLAKIEEKRGTYSITKKEYVCIFGDFNTAHLFSQLLFWFFPNKKGNKKTRIFKDGEDWVAKKREDWLKECCLTKYEYDYSIKKLKKFGVVKTKIYKFAGEPITHIAINVDKISEILEKYYNGIK